MKNARLRQPIEGDYALALGTATYCFALCEWNAVWCAERLKPGSLTEFRGLTAGGIARKLRNLVVQMPQSAEKVELSAAADEFVKLVRLRNSLVHGKPCSNAAKKSRLSDGGNILEVAELEDAADKFSECSIELNRLLHGFLKTYTPRGPAGASST